MVDETLGRVVLGPVGASQGGRVYERMTVLIISSVSLGVAIAAIVAASIYFRRQVRAVLDTQREIGQLSDELFGLLGFAKGAFASPELRKRLTMLAENYGCLAHQGGILADIANRQLEKCVQISSNAVAEYVDITPVYLEPYAVELIRLANAGDTLITTSYVRTAAFWSNPRTKSYVRENEAAVKRGVRVVRVFLFDDLTSLQQSEAEMDSQCEKGIRVRAALTSDLEPELWQDLFFLEGRVAAEYLLTSDRGDLRELRIWTATGDLRDYGETVRRVCDASTEHQVRGKHEG